MFKLYNDLKIEQQAYTEQLEFATETEKRLKNLLEIRKPHDMKGMSYDSVGQACRDDTTDDRTGVRYLYTRKRIDAYNDILSDIVHELKKVEDELTMCEGLQYKVFYLNRVKGLSLWRVSEELGYCYNYIANINSEINKMLTLP